MSVLTTPPRSERPVSIAGSAVVPPLENGDRLTRPEFHRRYLAMPPHVRAELIEGVVVMASPVRFTIHGEPHAEFMHFTMTYKHATSGVRCADNATVQLDIDNEFQPDIFLLIDPARGGTATITADGYIEGAPELVVEITSSSVSKDLGPKLNAYRRNGVQEYLVWRVQDEAIDWFVLRDGRYDRHTADADGITRSIVFPGLWLDIPAMLTGDLERVHAVLNDGLADPAHAAFVASLGKGKV
jgi:Uma2 family endonuclease